MFTGINILKTVVYGKKYPEKFRFTVRKILKTEIYGKKYP